MAKEAEFGVVGSGSNFGQDYDAENWCTKHSETSKRVAVRKKTRERNHLALNLLMKWPLVMTH